MLTGPPNPSAPTITITRSATHPAAPFAGKTVDEAHADVEFPSGVRLLLDRAAGTAQYGGPALPADERVHPYLSPVAVIHSRWLGREVFHAGVFTVAGQAWVAVGPRTAGKSSLLAGLDARDCVVLSDDVAVCSTDGVFSGPRCIDLREPLPGVVPSSTTSRGGQRYRLQLPPAPFAVPLGGWLFLGWGPDVELEPIRPDVLLGVLARRRLHRALPSDSELMLSLATKPAWHFRRPRDWSHADSALTALLGAVTTSAAVAR